MAGINRTTGKATDLITFSRASGGTALRKISYGSNEYTVANAVGNDTDATTGWTAASNAVLASQSANTNGSSFAFLIESNTTPSSNGGAFTDMTSFGLTSGRLYELSVDYRHVGTGGRWSIQLASATNTADGPEVDTTIDTADTTWTTATCLFVAGSATAAYLRVREVNGTNDGGVYIDNISVKEVLFDQPDGTLTLFNHPTNIPRIDYAADGTVKGLLIEEARTNLLTYSEDFNSSWTKFNGASVSTDQTISPDGNQTADLLTAGSSGESFIYRSSGTTTGQVVTFSVFVKAGTARYLQISPNFSGGQDVWVDMLDGSIASDETGGSASSTPAGNGWHRITISNLTDNSANKNILIGVTEVADNSNRWLGQGNSVYLWGAQLEAGSFPTSYIPTSGATATRAADIASISVDSFGYRQDAGTVVVEFDSSHTNNKGAFNLSVSAQNRISHYLGPNNKGLIVSDGVTSADMDAGASSGDFQKFAVAASANNFGAALNGGSPVSDSSGNMPLSATVLGIGYHYPGAGQLNICGHIKSIAYYPRRLSNAQLQELTA